MRLSIITINYNNLQGLIKTVDSVLLQTFHDFEWIIIDGGSTDGSKEYIEQLAKDLATRNWLTHKFSLSCYSADDNVKENFNPNLLSNASAEFKLVIFKSYLILVNKNMI